jgi:hypothetical protein
MPAINPEDRYQTADDGQQTKGTKGELQGAGGTALVLRF